MKRLLLLIVVGAVIALFAHALGSRDPTPPSPLVGRPAPDFTIPAFTGDSTLSLERFAGRPVVLNFWASWCFSCRDEALVLEKGWEKHGPGVAFVGVAVNDQPAPAREFIARYGKTYYLGPDRDGSVAMDYGIFGVPETFFIAPDGRILSKHVGPITPDELDRKIAALEAGEMGRATGDPGALDALPGTPR